MTTPQNPKDPDSLSLTPSSSGGGGKQADFSNVKGGADTVPGSSGGGGGTGGRPDFSNVTGGATTVPGNAGGGGGAAEQTYTVQKGDTLSHISKHFYGKASRWNAIFEANRDQLDDPDLIKPGQVLKIPHAD